jgi:subtilase family serine protease
MQTLRLTSGHLHISRTIVSLALLAAGGSSVACSSEPTTSSTASESAATVTPASQTGLVAPAWAVTATKTGALDASAPLSLQVHLQMRNETAARAQLEAISDPDDAQYGKFLTTEQFAAAYAPSADDVAAVRAHLESHGLAVGEVPANNAYVAATGTAAQVESAFSTHLSTYYVAGETRYAPDQAASLPEAVATRVKTVIGLSSPHKMRPMTLDLPLTAQNTEGCSKYFGQATVSGAPSFGDYVTPFPSYPCSGLFPPQVRHVYGIDVGTPAHPAGKGQTVAIVEVTTWPTLVQDVQTYITSHDPEYPLGASQLTLAVGPGAVNDPDPAWSVEEALDIDAIHTVAPGANIALYAASTGADADVLATLNVIIAGNKASVVSNSWSDIEAGNQALFSAYENMAIQAGLKGIGLYFASGDAGDNAVYNNGVPTPGLPCDLPEVTTVGGSSLTVDARGDRLFEVGWETGTASLGGAAGDDGGSADAGLDAEIAEAGAGGWSPAPPGVFTAGSGGGVSTVYVQPSWQKGIVPTALAEANAGGSPSRVVPDVAMMGDPYATGLQIGLTRAGATSYTEFFEGGSSLATPLFTAVMALAQEQAGRHFGNANALLYKASKHGAFLDCAPSAKRWAIDLAGASFLGGDLWTLDYAGPGNTLTSAEGFDDVTGLGVPNGQAFLDALEKH